MDIVLYTPTYRTKYLIQVVIIACGALAAIILSMYFSGFLGKCVDVEFKNLIYDKYIIANSMLNLTIKSSCNVSARVYIVDPLGNKKLIYVLNHSGTYNFSFPIYRVGDWHIEVLSSNDKLLYVRYFRAILDKYEADVEHYSYLSFWFSIASSIGSIIAVVMSVVSIWLSIRKSKH